MRSSRRFLRCVSLVTVSCFLFTQAGFAAPIDGISVSGGAAGPELPFAGHFQVPENLGVVSETYAVTSADRSLRERAIVLVQNGHGSYDAQRKVRELLRYLDTTYGIKTVFVEGAAEKLDASKIEFFADEERNRKVAEYLAEQGILNGAGLYLAEHPKGVEGLGLEDVKLYRANYEALKTVFEASARVEKILSRIETRLFSTYSRYASPASRGGRGLAAFRERPPRVHAVREPAP